METLLLIIPILTLLCESSFGQRPSCSLMSECCGMSNTNCCSTQSKCYTTWKRVCDDEEVIMQPSSTSSSQDFECHNVGRKICVPIVQKSCRTVTEKIFKSYVVSHCAASPLRTCFNYKRKVCTAKESVSNVDISWMNEKLVLNNASVVKKCFQLQTNECKEIMAPGSVRIPIRKTKIVQTMKDECTFKNTRSPDQFIKVPVTSIVNKQVCWNVPKTQCSTTSCGTAACPEQTMPCVAFSQMQSVCPLNPVVGQNSQCFNVPGPVCSQGQQCSGVGGQQCCSQATQRVCRNVPQRVTRMMSKAIPGKLSVQKVCQKVPMNQEQTYWDTEIRYNNKTRNDCKPTIKNECINLTVRDYEIQVENVTNSVPVRLPVCEHKEVDAEYCHTFPTGNIICRNTTIPKSFNLHKIKCDVSTRTTQCAVIPTLDCKSHNLAPANAQQGYQRVRKCRLEPRVVCPNAQSCENGAMCSQCENFRVSNGFGVCGSGGGDCTNFNSATSWSNEQEANTFLNQLYQRQDGSNSIVNDPNYTQKSMVKSISVGNSGNGMYTRTPIYSQDVGMMPMAQSGGIYSNAADSPTVVYSTPYRSFQGSGLSSSSSPSNNDKSKSK